MYRYDAQNSGTADTTGPKEPVEAVWTFETDGALRAQPLVADGKAYVVSEDSRVYAVSTETGEREWSVSTNDTVTTTPALANGLLYVATDAERLLALSPGTGSGQWAKSVSASNGQLPPIFTDGNLITARNHYDIPRLDVRDPATGDVETTVQAEDETNRRFKRIVATDGRLYVVETSGGEYYTWSGKIIAIDPSDGSEVWTEAQDSKLLDVSIGNGTLYVVMGEFDNEGGIVAYDAQSGEQQWTFTNLTKQVQAPTLADGTLYATSSDGDIYAIDPSIGTRKWNRSVSGTPTSPVVVDDTVYVGSTDNRVYAHDAVSGEQLWTFETDNGVVAPPTVLDGTVYVASTDGVLYALRERGSVSPGDVNGDGNPAQDLDEDGLYEDVNGDGAFTIVDVQALFANLDSDVVQNNPSKFDFNGDGEVDVTDVQALYDRLEN